MQQNTDKLQFPGIVVAGLRGGSGKTIFSIGVISAFQQRGILVAPFKKGPDYIDAGWLGLAAGRSCRNLDTFLMDSSVVVSSYCSHACFTDVSVVEGNRGLYDCIDVNGETSTAALAKLLDLPVVLCVDATKTTRTMAPIVSGVLGFDPDVRVCGVVLNRVAGTRHENILTRSIEEYCGVPILGAIPKLSHEFFPERHMGLVPTPEHTWANSSIETARGIIEKYVNIPYVLDVIGYTAVEENTDSSNKEATLFDGSISITTKEDKNKTDGPVIGVMKDSAFQFYYPENFEALIEAGARLVFISPIGDTTVPKIDALYIGGGFPETHAESLEKNTYMREMVKSFAEADMPIYAECGGLIYLGEKLIIGDRMFEMSGVLPAVFKIWRKPQGHGYTKLRVKKKNPYYPVGLELSGHEFHYSSVHAWKGKNSQFVFSTVRGSGFTHGSDGILYKNVLGTYTHVHALGTMTWATSLVDVAINYMNSK